MSLATDNPNFVILVKDESECQVLNIKMASNIVTKLAPLKNLDYKIGVTLNEKGKQVNSFLYFVNESAVCYGNII